MIIAAPIRKVSRPDHEQISEEKFFIMCSLDILYSSVICGHFRG